VLVQFFDKPPRAGRLINLGGLYLDKNRLHKLHGYSPNLRFQQAASAAAKA